MGKYSHTKVAQKLKELRDGQTLSPSELSEALGTQPPRTRTLISGNRRASDEEIKRFDNWLAENHPAIDLSLVEIRDLDPDDLPPSRGQSTKPRPDIKKQRLTPTPPTTKNMFVTLGFGAMLGALRRSIKMTQQEMAGRLGVSRDTIKEWEREKVKNDRKAPACPKQNSLEAMIKLIKEEQKKHPETALLDDNTEGKLTNKWEQLYNSSERRSVSLGAVKRNIPPETEKGR